METVIDDLLTFDARTLLLSTIAAIVMTALAATAIFTIEFFVQIHTHKL